MKQALRLAAVGVAGVLMNLSPVRASGNFVCEADDGSASVTAESHFSHGLGEVFTGFKAALKVRLKDAPSDLADVTFDASHLAHHWFHGPSLKLHLYRERPGNAAHGFVELVVETTQEPDDETAFSGTYKLVVYDVGSPSSGEGRTWRAEGAATCSAG